MAEIDFKIIEEKWQKKWEESKVFEVEDSVKGKENYYVLEMFPYPSGAGLHMGHAWNYTIGDIMARFKKMQGYNVLHPMGYDSLGLPAENAAIKAGEHPQEYNKKSISTFSKQMKEIGLSYDWSRSLSSDDPKYYKWDQWIFLKMFEKGLAYRKESPVNWCPSCTTVLANEQAQDGKCDRCESKVEIKHLTQWFLKITDYADEIYEGIDKLNWPERTKLMQKNWIGKSHGTEIDFLVNGEKWPVFTTRPDTIFGVTFVVVSLQHKKLLDLVKEEKKQEVEEFLKKTKSVSEKDMADLEKEGVFTGSYAVNPINGEEVPIYAGNFVVADYGSGMVMAVPAHDKRDYEFAKKYDLEIKEVVLGGNISEEAFTGNGKLSNSGEFENLKSEEAKEKITKYLEENNFGRKVVNFKLRDWGISRQRYWGTPIPIIHCRDCGIVPVFEKDLPVILPHEVKFGKGNPLETNEEWIKVKCPKCGKEGRRETETMDTFVNSSWYFMRYCDSKNDEKIFDEEKVKKWCPVDIYVGGSEHACMHLIYSRFYTKFLRDSGLIDFSEPAKKLFHQGMLYSEGGVKMSKSKPETCVLPEVVSEKYGMDTARFFLSNLASPDKDINWSSKGIVGSLRFINKIFDFVKDFKEGKDNIELEVKLNNTVKNVQEYYENFEYRKATIEIRELFEMIFEEGCSLKTLKNSLKLINPICPHITEEFWEKLGEENFICESSWPNFDSKKLEIKKQEIDLNEKVGKIVKILIEGKDFEKIYLYSVPFEFDKLDSKKLENLLGKEVKIYSVQDAEKYDPSNKSKKAKPGLPGIYLE